MSDRIVIFIHGIWMPRHEMSYIRHLLEKNYSLPGRLFSYPSVNGTLDENAHLLAGFINEQDASQVDLVGHSLGGVLALRTLLQHPDLPSGRVVCMGSPLRGSRAAAVLAGNGWGSGLIGKSLRPGVVEHTADEWASRVTGTRQVGSIAGTHALGMGRLVARFDEANDGTVAVSETMLTGVADHVCMHVTHTGMIFSKKVAHQVAGFLENGHFARTD